MSKIPKPPGVGKPIIKTTTTTTRIPGTPGTRTTTRTEITELRPCTTGPCSTTCSGDKSARSGIAAGQCSAPSTSRAALSASGTFRAPSGAAGTSSRLQPSRTGNQPAAARLPAATPGRYGVPAQYGPQSVKGKGVTYSSPEGLRGQMESNLPKGLKYFSTKPPVGGRDRAAMQKTRLQDTFSGSFNVYGPSGAQATCGRMDSSLERRIDGPTAAELLNMSSPNVSGVEGRVHEDLMSKTMHDPTIRVFAKGQEVQQVDQQTIQTPLGPQPVIQQFYTEKRLERDEGSEKLVKNLSMVEVDEESGNATRVTISEQQIDPQYALPRKGRDVVTIRESVSVTPSYTSTAKDVVHEAVKITPEVDPGELARLVQQEKEDVENTLKMVPPDLTLDPEKYGVKKRLQKLRLNSESMVLLEQSVVNPTPTADDALVETPPEAIAKIMHTVESGVTPQCAPDQVFHTLFQEKTTYQAITVSSVGPGPLQDVVVPQEINTEIHKESMSADMNKLTEKMKNMVDMEAVPFPDIFSSVMDDAAKSSAAKGQKIRPFKPISDEEAPWGTEDIEPIVNLIGAEPTEVLDPVNVQDLQMAGKLEDELTNGIEYFMDADPVQYMSRVHLRGSHPPSWFPGYIYALPEFQDVVKLARDADEVLYSSWKSCQPRIIPDTSMSILH